MFSYFLEPLGAEKVVFSLITSFKNRLWHVLKKLPKMSSKTTPFWYLLGANFMNFRVPKSMQQSSEKNHATGFASARVDGPGLPLREATRLTS